VKYYTGIGSRSTPAHIQQLISKISFKLAEEGYTLRSGAAYGADKAFEIGVKEYFNTFGDSYPASSDLAQIYTPWRSFCEIDEDYKDWYYVLTEQRSKDQAEQLAKNIHPAWERCSRGAKALHTRNVYQVLGVTLNSLSSFLIAYAEPTKTGVKGGTSTAWDLAGQHNIPRFNLYNKEDRDRIEAWLFKG